MNSIASACLVSCCLLSSIHKLGAEPMNALSAPASFTGEATISGSLPHPAIVGIVMQFTPCRVQSAIRERMISWTLLPPWPRKPPAESTNSFATPTTPPHIKVPCGLSTHGLMATWSNGCIPAHNSIPDMPLHRRFSWRQTQHAHRKSNTLCNRTASTPAAP